MDDEGAAGRGGPLESEAEASGLVAIGIGKSYRQRQVVRGVSLSLRRGEVVGLLGPNGAGKTTCFYIDNGARARGLRQYPDRRPGRDIAPDVSARAPGRWLSAARAVDFPRHDGLRKHHVHRGAGRAEQGCAPGGGRKPSARIAHREFTRSTRARAVRRRTPAASKSRAR